MHTATSGTYGKDSISRSRFIVSGNVQKVRYRDYIADNARKLSLKGQVQNMPDGTVEIITEGHPENLMKFEEFMKKDKERKKASSDGCLATDIDYKKLDEEATGKFPMFNIVYSNSVQEELNENFGAALEVQMQTNTAIQGLTTQTCSKFDTMDAKYGIISENIKNLTTQLSKIAEALKPSK